MALIIDIYTQRKTKMFAVAVVAIVLTFIYILDLGFSQLSANVTVSVLFISLCIVAIIQGLEIERLRQSNW